MSAQTGDVVAWQYQNVWQFGVVVSHTAHNSIAYVRPFHGRHPGAYPKEAADLTVIMPAAEFLTGLEYQRTHP